MRRYLRTLWGALLGRPITEVEFSHPLRLTWKGRTAFVGRVVGYQISMEPDLGGATATVSLHDATHDLRLLTTSRARGPEPTGVQVDEVARYERYGQEAPDWTI